MIDEVDAHRSMRKWSSTISPCCTYSYWALCVAQAPDYCLCCMGPESVLSSSQAALPLWAWPFRAYATVVVGKSNLGL
jgi:hypothetical protein